MRGCVCESDIVARLGGDEFAVVQVTFEGPADAVALATRLIEAVREPYWLDGHQIIVGTSIGIAIAPRDGTVTDELMKKADLALYRCKADGGCAYRFFEPQMDARRQERRAPESGIHAPRPAVKRPRQRNPTGAADHVHFRRARSRGPSPRPCRCR